MSLRNELMIPFRGIGDAGRSIRPGSAVLLRHGRRLVERGLRRIPRPKKGMSLGDKTETLVLVAFGALGAVVLLAAIGGFLARILAPYAPCLVMVTLAAWVVAAMVVAPTQGYAVKTAGKPESSAPPPSAEALSRLVRTLAASRSQRGVHLEELLRHLPGVDRAALVATLREAGIPVKEQLKLHLPNGRQVNRQGVLVEALPPTGEAVGSEPSRPGAAPGGAGSAVQGA